MFLTMLSDLAVFWLYVTLICSFFTLHYITLHTVMMKPYYSTSWWGLGLPPLSKFWKFIL